MKRHKFDTLSFVAGLIITVIGLIFLLPAEPGDLVDFFGGFDDLTSWLWPLLFIGIGALVLLPVLLKRSSQDEEAEDSTDELTQTR